jgi:hypothetical protein
MHHQIPIEIWLVRYPEPILSSLDVNESLIHKHVSHISSIDRELVCKGSESLDPLPYGDMTPMDDGL